MCRKNYDACLAHVLKWEGGYVNHPKDPGGATKYGITIGSLADFRRRTTTEQDVKNLTIAEAGRIYRKGYWNPIKGDELPQGLDLVAYDGAVNSGPSRGAKWLQKGLGVAADGKIGRETLGAALMANDTVGVIQKASAARMSFLRILRTWSTFGRGWARRVADTEAEAVAMATQSPDRVKAEADKAQSASATHAKGARATPVGGGGALLVDLPEWALWSVIGVLTVCTLILALNAAQHARRAAAYREKLEEMTKG
ncbi:glycoside hydrolase family 108 protein [Ruegeria arenilitoris]|uniref:glycoside hydrolase family 108 protein n=1 Tax=Ruegeria arenilitoris TaxID=1173585 RepID=UPI00147CE9F9|nr:glycoside hydrolase family 108 protein [Ruegeria arenilitoris]